MSTVLFPPGPVRHWFAIALGVVFAQQLSVLSLRLMSVYAALDMGAGPVGVGVVAAAFPAAPIVAAIPVGRLVDRHGEGPFVLAGIAALAGGCAAAMLAGTLLVLVSAQVLAGLGQLASMVALQAMLATAPTRLRRDAVFGRLTVAASLGGLLGPLAAAAVAGTGDKVDPARGLAIAVGSAVAGTALAVPLWRHRPAVVRRSSAPNPLGGEVTATGSPGSASAGSGSAGSGFAGSGSAGSGSAGSGFAGSGFAGSGFAGSGSAGSRRTAALLRIRSLPQVLAASLTVLIGVDLLIAYLPVYGRDQAITVEAVGTLLTIRGVFALIARLGTDRLVSSMSRPRLLGVGLAAAAAAFAAVPLTASLAVLTGLMAVIGFWLGVATPVTMAWAADLAPDGARGTVMALRITGNRIGMTAVPLSAGAVAGLTGLASTFWLAAALLAAAATAIGTTVRRPG